MQTHDLRYTGSVPRSHLVQQDYLTRQSRERRQYLRVRRLLHAQMFYLIYGSRSRRTPPLVTETFTTIQRQTLEASVDAALNSRSSARTQPWGAL